jgi:hypothetical protein
MPGDETGDGEGDWYKCWSCGMACNDVTDEVDDGASKVRISHEDYHTVSLGSIVDSPIIVINGGFDSDMVALFNVKLRLANADGSAREVVHEYKIVDTRGCPNDGNLNWRGDY